MKIVVYGFVILLAILHQDFWWWDEIEPLVFGFLPIGLAYHVGLSLAAGLAWAAATKFCWPTGVDFADAMPDATPPAHGKHS